MVYSSTNKVKGSGGEMQILIPAQQLQSKEGNHCVPEAKLLNHVGWSSLEKPHLNIESTDLLEWSDSRELKCYRSIAKITLGYL